MQCTTFHNGSLTPGIKLSKSKTGKYLTFLGQKGKRSKHQLVFMDYRRDAYTPVVDEKTDTVNVAYPSRRTIVKKRPQRSLGKCKGGNDANGIVSLVGKSNLNLRMLDPGDHINIYNPEGKFVEKVTVTKSPRRPFNFIETDCANLHSNEDDSFVYEFIKPKKLTESEEYVLRRTKKSQVKRLIRVVTSSPDEGNRRIDGSCVDFETFPTKISEGWGYINGQKFVDSIWVLDDMDSLKVTTSRKRPRRSVYH